MSDENLRHAKDEKCVECGQQACCFWPCVDPDIESFPYCRPCVEKAKLSLMLRFQETKKKGPEML